MGAARMSVTFEIFPMSEYSIDIEYIFHIPKRKSASSTYDDYLFNVPIVFSRYEDTLSQENWDQRRRNMEHGAVCERRINSAIIFVGKAEVV